MSRTGDKRRKWEEWLRTGDKSTLTRYDGVIAVYKPQDVTSADVVQKIRRALEASLIADGVPRKPRGKPLLKVGHGGTLDPLAEGVLVIGIGTGCREMEAYLKGEKRYRGQGLLGTETDTQDCTGQVTHTAPWEHVTRAKLLEVLPQFRGDIQQVPPMYSALKKDGKRLYELARRGEVVHREARQVHISHLELHLGQEACTRHEEEAHSKEQPYTGGPAETVQPALPAFALEIGCGGGTYVRTLIEDIARAASSAAHMTDLVRTKQGVFTLEDCLSHESCADEEAIVAHLSAKR